MVTAVSNVPPPPLMPRADGGRGARPLEVTPAPGRTQGASSGRAPDSYSPDGPTPPRARRAVQPPSSRSFDVSLFARDPGRDHEADPFGGGLEVHPDPASDLPPDSPPPFQTSVMSSPEHPFRRQALEEIPELTVPPMDVLSTHLTEAGDARMVDVGAKPVTERRAVASAVVHMRRETFHRLAQRDTPKGDVLASARIAGIMAAKRTSELIPLCHAIALTSVEVQLDLDEGTSSVLVTAIAQASDRTGVEMEALVAASVAGLTVYDMLKGIDRDMKIDDVKLLEKSGGRTGHYQRREA